MTAKVIDCRKIAKELRADISKEVNKLKSIYKTKPNITTIKINVFAIFNNNY